MVGAMSITNDDINAEWAIGDPVVITMDGDSDGTDGTDGTDGDATDGTDGDATDGDGGDADGGDA